MKKLMYAAGVFAAAAALLAVLVTRVDAQQRDRVIGPSILTLEGPGSTVGLQVRDANDDEVQKAGTPGVIVLRVREGTPAARAGVRESDIVTEFDGERVRSVRQFTRLVRETPPGRMVKMTVLRAGNRQTLDITPEQRGAANHVFPDIAAEVQRGLRNLPRDFQFDFDGRGGVLFSPQRLGVTVTNLSDQLAAYFGVKQGVLVTDVQPNSPAEAAGVKAGDVITSVNGEAVTGPNDVLRATRDTEAGGSIALHVTRDRRDVALTATMPARPEPATARSGVPI